MAIIWEDRVVETTTTTGTGALTLAGAVTGHQAFSSVCSTGSTCYYVIEGIDANGAPSGEWETGLGTYSGVNTLTRTTVISSSNAGSAVTLSAGTKRVALAPNASISQRYEAALTPPSAASFTLQNAGTASITDGRYGVILDAPSTGGDIRFVKSNTAPGSSFTMTTRLASHQMLIGSGYARCLIARNSTSGRIIIAGIYNTSTQYLVQRWSSYTAFNTNVLAPVTSPIVTLNWWRMSCDGTTLSFQSSADGLTWATVQTEALATYINASGGTVDQIGWGCFSGSANVLDTCQSFVQV